MYTQLLSVLQAIGQALDKNIQTDVIYLHFAKAFDSVDRTIFLAKLRAYGISGQLLAWFVDYITGRAQRVVLDGAASQWAPVTSGVPQGSLLGPLLFKILINYLPGETVGQRYTLITPSRIKASAPSASLSLQTALVNLNDWSKGNNINFNTSKCKTLTVTRKKTPLIYEYTLDNTQLVRVFAEKDLGVTITSTLSYHSHINTITAIANKLFGLQKRTCPLLTDVSTRRTP